MHAIDPYYVQKHSCHKNQSHKAISFTFSLKAR